MRTKTKPKYAIVFCNKKDEYTIIGMANLDAYSMFLIDLSKDKTIKEFFGYEYAEIKQFGWDKEIQLTLMGPADRIYPFISIIDGSDSLELNAKLSGYYKPKKTKEK